MINMYNKFEFVENVLMVKESDKKLYKIEKEDILGELNNSKYKDRCQIYSTYFEQGQKRWKYGKRNEFEKSLIEGKLYYFAYIKFYLENDKKYALVAGKSGSRNVNAYGSDVRFRESPYKGKAKEWLDNNSRKWCETEILIISTVKTEKKSSEDEAKEIEKFLVNTFGLFQS